MTFGSMMINSPDYLHEVARIWTRAARLAGVRAIIQLPWGDLSSYADGPDVIAVRRLPYSKVFPQCALVVHHGGAGTTQSALFAGRPCIIVAHVSDQFFWGSEIERLGVGGKTLRKMGLRAELLAEGIRQVLANPQLAVNAKDLGDRMREEDGVGNALRLSKRVCSQLPRQASDPVHADRSRSAVIDEL